MSKASVNLWLPTTGERIVRKTANSYGGICIGTIQSITGSMAIIRWDGKWSNLKKDIAISKIAPFAELPQIKQKIQSRNQKKLEKDIAHVWKQFNLLKAEDGWLYNWNSQIMRMMPSQLEDEQFFYYEEKRHPEMGYQWAVKLTQKQEENALDILHSKAHSN
jgi:hypothetical protein